MRIITERISFEYFPESIVCFSSNHYSNVGHPTEKPEELFEYLIKTYSNEGDTVLDCFAGSGTTAIAALNTKRNYILIEKEQEYFDMTTERIKAYHEFRPFHRNIDKSQIGIFEQS